MLHSLSDFQCCLSPKYSVYSFFFWEGGVPFLTMAASGKESWKNIGDVKGICFSFYAVYLLNVFPCILCDGKGEECYRQTEIKKGG